MKLKELRLKNGYTQKEIAEKIKTNRANYNRYELEKGEPSIETLIKLADQYHVTLDELVGRKQENIIDKGLLSELELSIIDVMQKLNKENQIRLEASAYALLQVQQEQEKIIKEFKRVK